MRKRGEEEIKKVVENSKQTQQKAIAQAKKEVANTYEGKMEAMRIKYTAIIEVNMISTEETTRQC